MVSHDVISVDGSPHSIRRKCPQKEWSMVPLFCDFLSLTDQLEHNSSPGISNQTNSTGDQRDSLDPQEHEFSRKLSHGFETGSCLEVRSVTLSIQSKHALEMNKRRLALRWTKIIRGHEWKQVF